MARSARLGRQADASARLFIHPLSLQYLDTIVPETAVNIGAMRINLLAALVSGGAAAQTTDMTGDLKTGQSAAIASLGLLFRL